MAVKVNRKLNACIALAVSRWLFAIFGGIQTPKLFIEKIIFSQKRLDLAGLILTSLDLA
jgi:hypothetical protein